MLGELALAALLDTASVQTAARPETVYVERTVNPQAAPKIEHEHGSKVVQYVIGAAAIIGGGYLFIDGVNHRDETVVVDGETGQLKKKQTGWDNKMTLGLVGFGFGIVLCAN